MITENFDSRKWNTDDNAAALQGLQSSGPEDRIANATEPTAKDVTNNRPASV